MFFKPVGYAATTAAISLVSFAPAALAATFSLTNASLADINNAFDQNALTSASLTQLYLNRIDAYEGQLNNFVTLNPKALETAIALDTERQVSGPRSLLHGIPVLLKDNIDTFDLPTTAGSVALEGSIPPDDAFIADQLRDAGAIILGKASLTEFANFLTTGMPAGYSSLNGYTFNPYNPFPLEGGDGRPVLSPGGSSAGSAAAVAASLVPISIGTETSGSILSPANQNSVVGIKPTVGLVSRDGIIPIAVSQDTAGPFGKTVADAATLLGFLTGIDPNDPATATSVGKSFTDYTQFLDKDALAGTRIGVPKERYWTGLDESEIAILEEAIATIESLGATIVYEDILNQEAVNDLGFSVLVYEFKRDLNAYLASLVAEAPVGSLAEVIAFNEANADVALKYGQVLALLSEAVDLSPESADTLDYLAARAADLQVAKEEGIDAYIDTYDLDAILFPANRGAGIAAKAGYPSVLVPAGYRESGAPYGVTFSGLAYSEPELIGFAYAYEQASKERIAPTLFPALAGEDFEYEVVPEPGTLPALVALGTVLLGYQIVKRRSTQGKSARSV